MIEKRKEIFDKISRLWAITRYDIEHHQAIGEFSLNIHGENFFRDLFNDLYNLNLKNANFKSSNNPCIDLIDSDKQLAYQITTERTSQKIKNTLKILKDRKYNGFDIKIFYLLNKSKPNQQTIQEMKESYGVDLSKKIFDYNDIIKDINDLEYEKLVYIYKKYFKNMSEDYTNHKVLDLVVKHLIKKAQTIKKDYDDDFGTIEIKEKLELNNINERIASYIKTGQDYRSLMEELTSDNSVSDLRHYIIDDVYKKILIESVSQKKKIESLSNSVKTIDLQKQAIELEIDFNKLIKKLYQKIEDELKIEDFNSINIPWIIIGYFFEICDIGGHQQ